MAARNGQEDQQNGQIGAKASTKGGCDTAGEGAAHPHPPFFATRCITLGEADWLKCKEAGRGAAPSLSIGVAYHPPISEDTMLRYGLGQPSFVEAWAERGEAKARAVCVAEVEAIPPSSFGFDTGDSDWE